MQGSAHLILRSLGITQADGALIRDSPALLERIKTLEPRNARERLEKALTTYEDFYSGKTPFRIVVVGSQGVGKSNFVNNFLGTKQPLLPSQRGGRAVTLAPTIITYGENYRLSVFPTSYSPDLSFSQEEPLLQALHALQQKQQQEALPNHLNRVRNELKKMVEHQEEMDKLEEKLGRAKVEKSKKKLRAELEELSRARPKFELDFERGVPEKEPLERIMITLPNNSLKGIEIVDCPGYSDKDHDTRLVAPMLHDAHCLAVIAARLPSQLEFNDALERNCMASSLLVVWRWSDESEERRQKSLSDMPAVMEQAYHKRFMEERRLPFQAEQLIRCSTMRSFLTEFDRPKLDWVVQAREHHLEKLAEWLVVCLQAVETPLPRPPSLDQVSLLIEFQRIIQKVVAFYEPTRLSNLTREKMKLVTSILENVTRQARDTVFCLVAQSVTPEKQELLRVALMIDSLSVPPLPSNIQTTLYEEMMKTWPTNVIQAIVVGREQTNRDKCLQARLDEDALCRKFSDFLEAALGGWFLDLVKLIS